MENNPLYQKSSIIFCKISFNEGERWINGILTYLSIEKNVAEVFISSKYFNSFFKSSNKVIVKSLNSEKEVLFEGVVDKKIISINKQTITIKIQHSSNYNNNRKYERFEVNYAANILSHFNSLKTPALVNNISFGGIELISEAILEENSKALIQIHISGNKSISFLGEVIRIINYQKKYKYAFKVVEIDESNSMLLDELMDQLIIKKNHIKYEFMMFKDFKFTIYAVSVLLLFIVFLLCIFLIYL